jgi:hypothetical protein
MGHFIGLAWRALLGEVPQSVAAYKIAGRAQTRILADTYYRFDWPVTTATEALFAAPFLFEEIRRWQRKM